MGHQVTEPAAIEAEIDQLRSFALDALRRRWQVVFGRRPPSALNKDLLRRMIACRIQELAFGGLDRDSLRFLESLARQGGPPRRHLKAGTTLVRDYKGRRHTITVERDGGRGGPIPACRRLHARLPARLGADPDFSVSAQAP